MKKRFHIRFEYRISIAYLLLGALWIFFSDKLVNLLFTDTAVRASIQLYKGWFYVFLTAVFFFIFIKRHVRQLRESRAILSKKNLELKTIQHELEDKNAELLKAKDEAEESSKLKTAFLNNISHELRTPMNSILGFTGILTRNEIPNDQRRTYSAYIEQSAHQLLDMVTDIVEISQIQSGEILLHEQVCGLKEILDSVVEKAKKKIVGKPVNLSLAFPVDDKRMRLDKYKLTRVLDHLLDNAIKFTSKGKIEFRCVADEEELLFDIIDTGIGISKDLQDKIFDAFRQEEIGSKREYGGSGLGLTIVKAYIEMLEGQIHLESIRDTGTTIRMSIPCRPSDSLAVNNGDQYPEQHTFSGRTVLIADDEIFNYYYLKELLDHMEIRSLYATNGQEVVDLCKREPEVDLVLMDIMMPVMDGHEAARQIREFNPDIPLIAQSAYVLASSDLPEHFDDSLPKPILQRDLKELIAKYLH